MSLIRKGKDKNVQSVIKKQSGENLIKAKHLREQLVKADEKYLALIKSMNETEAQLRILSEKVDTLITSDKKVHEEIEKGPEDKIEELKEKIETTEDES